MMAPHPQPRLATPSHTAPADVSTAPRAIERFIRPRERSAPLVVARKKQNSSRPPRASPRTPGTVLSSKRFLVLAYMDCSPDMLRVQRNYSVITESVRRHRSPELRT